LFCSITHRSQYGGSAAHQDINTHSKNRKSHEKRKYIREKNRITIEVVESPEKRGVHGQCRCSQTAALMQSEVVSVS